MYKLCSLKVPYQNMQHHLGFDNIEIISSLDFDICYQEYVTVTTYV